MADEEEEEDDEGGGVEDGEVSQGGEDVEHRDDLDAQDDTEEDMQGDEEEMRGEDIGFARITRGTGGDVGMDLLEGMNVVSVSNLQQR